MARGCCLASILSYIDPSSGSSGMIRRETALELLGSRGWDCRALSCGVLDYQENTSLEDVLAAIERPAARAGASLSQGGEAEVFDLDLDKVRVTLLPTAFSRAERAPSPREAAIFLDLAEQVLERFRPEILLTYGGHPACLELLRRARAKGVAVVFHLHNFGYNDRRGFADVSAVIFPSEYSRRHYRRTVGLDGPVIPDPIRLDKVIAENREPKYATFINPQPRKGAAVFRARMRLRARLSRPAARYSLVGCRGARQGRRRLAGLQEIRPVGPDEV